ncbi:NAD(P) transhydrogenase subunit alpha [Sulfobacillus thermotolerans]|uniref:proton-translocating NAD(P)(+) transhydrogenase n=1 Tax=Sulfobacillus thermotolerans TaxID=338644 RepID=A0ABM6RQ94_9FIRM|nr:NAD(P) transhydrogenase subunit alpha [Sulfobacillus thermotolerans]
MIIAVPRERGARERRVALIPETVAKLVKADHAVLVEEGAGIASGFSDQQYRDAGATVVAGSKSDWMRDADIAVSVQVIDPSAQDLPYAHLRAGAVAIGMLGPLSTDVEVFKALRDRNLTAFSMDAIPRISRAQSMDVLSSMSTVAGYRAALIGAERLPRFFPLLMTAAGTITPAKVLILGAGVAGLQAIATTHRLGAVVQAFDTRPVVREQVESLGASFLALEVQSQQTQDGYAQALAEDAHQAEVNLLSKPVAEADVVITTALIPGRPAPILVTEEMVKSMRPGAVIVDLAAEAGGNCALSRPGETVVTDNGVTIEAPLNIASQLAPHASQLYSRNVYNFLTHLFAMGLADKALNLDDEIVARTMIVHDGTITHEALKNRINA